MSKSKARFLAELLSSDGKVIKTKSQASTIVVGDLPTIPNSKLQNSSVTIAGEGLSLGASLTLDTGDVTEHTAYKYYTDARADARIVNAGSANWNTAYGWGNHASAGYSTTDTTYSVQDGELSQNNFTNADHSKLDGIAASANNYSHPSNHAISVITGLQTALDGKVDDSQVLTNVPSGAVFTDTNTTYSVGDGGLSQNNFTNADHSKLDGIATGATNTAAPHYTSAIAVGAGGLTQQNFTTTLKNKLDGIAASANNYVLPFTNNSSNWNTAYGWGNHASAGYTNDQTPAEILTALKTVDVNGTAGVNAGTFDGLQATSFLRSDAADSGGTTTGSSLNIPYLKTNMLLVGATNFADTINGAPWYGLGKSTLVGYHSNNSTMSQLANYWGLRLQTATARMDMTPTGYTGNILFGAGTDVSGTTWARINSTGLYQGLSNLVWHAGNDGSGSGLDADLLDGQQGSYYRAYANLTGTPTIPSLSGYATESYVGTQISNLVDSSPAALNTLNELAAAIGDDASFSTTVTNNIATKLPKAGGTMTGVLTINHTNDAQLSLTSPSSWTGIAFNDSASTGVQYIWHNGTHGTFAIGGNGSNVANKKLHVDGGMTIGSSYDSTAVSANSLNVQGTVTATGGNSTNWNTAHGWGNHASAGYVTSSGNTIIGTDTDLSFSGANVLSTIALTDGVITAYTNRTLTPANIGAPTLSASYRTTSSVDGAVSSAGWVTVATNTSGRKHGEIIVSDSDSGDHAFIRIDWMRSYADSNFSVLQVGGHGNRITGVRVLSQDSENTYGVKRLQVYVTTGSTYGVRVNTVGGPRGFGTHSTVTPVIENTKVGYTVHGNELTGLDAVSLAAEEGIKAGGIVYASGGNSTNWNTAYGWGNHASGGYAPASHAHSYLPLTGGTLTGNLAGTTASFSGKVDFQGDAAIEGGSGYGVFKGYTGNNNHFIVVRGAVANSSTLSITGAHQTTFVEHAENNDTSGWFFKSNQTGSYAEIARITRTGGMHLQGNKVWHAGNDGSGSTLDADLLDGRHASEFVEHMDGSRTNAANLNSYTDSGFYNTGAATISNKPSGASDYAQLIVAKGIDTGLQLYGGYNNPTLYVRGWHQSGTFFAWRKLWNDSNDGSGSGLDADLLDGINSGSFLRSDTLDVMTYNTTTGEMLKFANNTSGGKIQIGFQQNDSDGMHHRAYLKFWKGSASASGNVDLIVRGSGGSLTSDVLSLRSGNASPTWRGQAIWNAGNDGSGSGLDADLLDGCNAEETAVANSIVKRDGNARIEAKKLYLNGGNYEGQIIFGAVDAWRTGIRQHDDGDAEMRIWAKNAAGRVHIATGYDGQPASIARPTDGFVVNANNVGIGDFSGDDPSQKLHVKGNILMSGGTMRASHSKGHQIGSYNNIGGNGTKSNPIYTIGSSYNPGDAALSNMYGIGYTDTSASFINFTGAGSWGMYVAADGDARVWLGGSNGVISSTGQHYVGSNVVWNAGNDGPGSGLDADLLDGQQGSYYYAASNPSGYQTTSGTVAQSHYVSGSAFATTSSPGSVLEYQQASGQTDTRLAPSGDWHNSIRMGHGNPYNYYSNTIAARMTGTGPGDLYTQSIYNNTANGWRKLWSSGNDGSGSGLDADLLDGKSHENFGATLATFGTTSGTGGRIRCTAPFNTNSGKMFQVTVSLYTSYQVRNYVVAGYMYSTSNQWYSATAIYSGAGTPDIKVGRDSSGKAYISIARGSYTGVRVHSMTRGYYTSVADTYDPWTITENDATENSLTPTTSTTWHSTNDGSGSGLDADLLDGYNAEETAVNNSIVKRDGTATIKVNGVYLGGTGAANKLDDYEEGTWTPTSSVVTSLGINFAKYTKIGSQVTVLCQFYGRPDKNQNNYDTYRIGGLPFQPNADAVGGVGKCGGQYFYAHNAVARSGTNYIEFYTQGSQNYPSVDNDVYYNQDHYDYGNDGTQANQANDHVDITITYLTDQ